jgi:hypothetical protein
MIDSKTSAYNFETVKDDFLDVKKHTLSNGLTLFLSVNKDEPRIFTNIAVRAGSKHDPRRDHRPGSLHGAHAL